MSLINIDSTQDISSNEQICFHLDIGNEEIGKEESDINQLTNAEETGPTSNCKSSENGNSNGKKSSNEQIHFYLDIGSEVEIYEEGSDNRENEIPLENVHIKSTKTQKNTFLCPYCDKNCYTSDNLKQHIWIHSRKNPYFWPVCDGPSGTKYGILSYKPIHKNSSKRVQCPKCSEFIKICNFKQHINNTHLDTKIYKCKICNKRYRCCKSWQSHVTYHPSEFSFKCVVCEKAFEYHNNLFVHCITHHVPFTIFSCEICGKMTSDFKKHWEYYHKSHAIRKLKLQEK